MDKSIAKTVRRDRRKMGQRKTLRGTPTRPRLRVYRSLQHIYAQVIDDTPEQALRSNRTLPPARLLAALGFHA